MTTSTKWFLTFLLVAAILVGAVYYLYSKDVATPEPAQNLPGNTTTQENTVTTQEVATEEFPKDLPLSLPIETGAEITQNYTASTPDGRTQSTRAFISKKTLDENFKLYTDYLKQNNWTISATVNQPTFKVISANSGTSTLKIDMNTDASTKNNTIVISLIQSN